METSMEILQYTKNRTIRIWLSYYWVYMQSKWNQHIKQICGQAWWYTAIILALRRLKEDYQIASTEVEFVGKWLGYKGRALICGISIFIKEVPESCFSQSHHVSSLQLKRGPSPRLDLAGPLILDIPVCPQNCEK
jgi:hypothetical protein